MIIIQIYYFFSSKDSTIERPPSANRNKAPIVKEKDTSEQKDIKTKNVP